VPMTSRMIYALRSGLTSYVVLLTAFYVDKRPQLERAIGWSHARAKQDRRRSDGAAGERNPRAVDLLQAASYATRGVVRGRDARVALRARRSPTPPSRQIIRYKASN
jgi:hypothetical protein